MGWFHGLRRHCTSRLLSLEEVLTTLGDDGPDTRLRAAVPLHDIVGSLSRSRDFDEDFGLLNRALRDRWAAVARAVESGGDPARVELIQVGDLYFVVDGHHRVSVSRALGRDTIPATVLRVCTTAYGHCRLRPANLPTKAAERRFLERVPLQIGLRCGLWLDSPDAWQRLADTAESWASRCARETGRVLSRCELAEAWWALEVRPVVAAARRTGRGVGLRDIEVYADTLRPST